MTGGDIELVSLTSPDLGTVSVDPARMEQVLVNLVAYARDALPNGSKIVLETANVTLADGDVRSYPAPTPGEYVMFAVSDNGAGMTD